MSENVSETSSSINKTESSALLARACAMGRTFNLWSKDTEQDHMNALTSVVPRCIDAQVILLGLEAMFEADEDLRRTFGSPDVWQYTLPFLDHGPYILRSFVSNPWMLEDILSHALFGEPRLVNVHAFEERLREMISSLRGDAMMALRQFKRLESLRLFFYETQGRHSVSETTAGIADLAQACLDIALSVACHEAGAPEMFKHICFLGMGKLGGRELNYSSDVDIIAMCSDLIFSDLDGRQVVESIVRRVIALMDETTAQGYVFRVDLRLRPEGTQGRLVQCPDAMVDYYLNWGRTWERSAMIKARPVAGSLELGDLLLQKLSPFVFKKYLDYTAIDELRAMKEMVNQNAHLRAVVGTRRAAQTPSVAPVQKATSRLHRAHQARQQKARPMMHRRRVAQQTVIPPQSIEEEDTPLQRDAPLGWDVKLGVGGIREVEFFVQALQLVHCGGRPGLRVKNTLEALDLLVYTGLLANDDHEALAQSYDFYRRLEHRVQMENDRQTHRLPTQDNAFAHLASRMGMSSEILDTRIRHHRAEVSRMFGRLFEESAQTSDEPTVGSAKVDQLGALMTLPTAQLLRQDVYDTFEAHGFERGRQVAGQLKMLKAQDYGPFGTRATATSQKFASSLLGVCAASANPDRAFGFIARLVTTVRDKSWFWSMLEENPHATQLLVHVFGSSDYLSAMLLKNPNIIQDLLGVGSAQIERSEEELKQSLDTRLETLVDLDHRWGRVHRFRQEEIIRLSLHELGGAATIDQTTSQLARLAQLIISTLLRDIYEYQRGQTGQLTWPSFVDMPFCVVAMGKLGGQSLGFGSDLDVFFVYDDEADCPLDHVFYARLAQRFVRAISSVGHDGRLYEIDTRLRPSGQRGTLVVSLSALRAYYRDRASLWEKQALILARPLTGALSLQRKLMRWRHEVAFTQALPVDALTQTKEMRQAMREHMAPSNQWDLKHSLGGLIDIEFLTQYLQWMAYRANPFAFSIPEQDEFLLDGICAQQTVCALNALAKDAWIQATYPSLQCEVMVEDYRMLRRIEAILRVEDGRSHSLIPVALRPRKMLARRLKFHAEEGIEQFDAMISRLFERGEHAWTAVFGED